MQDLETLSLDELFKEAKSVLRAEREAETKAKKEPRRKGQPERVVPSELYSKPENWRKGRSIALIHEGSSTLLGHFREFLHTSVPECRRLVREDSPALVESVEYVSGDWGYKAPPELGHQDSTITSTLLEGQELILVDPAVRVASTQISIVRQGAGILRIELGSAATFHNQSVGIILQLPSGTNVLPVLSPQTKAAIREALSDVH